jgi:hydrogenase maturation protease
MIPPNGAVAVLGVGNVLLGDDGVGVRVVQDLRGEASRDPGVLPPGTRLVDAGTLGLDALAALAGATSLIVVDAIDLGLPPGSIRVLREDAMGVAEGRPAQLNDNVRGLLATARLAGWLPRSVTLVGVQVSGIGPGTRLSDEVEAAVASTVTAVREEVACMRAVA